MEARDQLLIANARRFVAQVTMEQVAAIIVGNEGDGSYIMSVHAEDVPDGEGTQDVVWVEREGQRVQLRETTHHAIAVAARERWPEVKIYDCRCTCCTDGLREIREIDPERRFSAAA